MYKHPPPPSLPFLRIHATNTHPRIDIPTRLRRAILLNDIALVKRIVRNNPTLLRNPDFEDKGNTSLHLAARLGALGVVVSVSLLFNWEEEGVGIELLHARWRSFRDKFEELKWRSRLKRLWEDLGNGYLT